MITPTTPSTPPTPSSPTTHAWLNRDDVTTRCHALAARTDLELSASLLGRILVHRTQPRSVLTRWAQVAAEFGADLAAHASEPEPPQPTRYFGTGVATGRVTLASYSHRHGVSLHADAIAITEELIDRLGWRRWYPAGAVEAATLSHEHAHGLLNRDRLRQLRHRADHRAWRLGRRSRACTVVGLDEHVAHGFTQQRVGLGRSPVLLTAALGVVADVSRQPTPDHRATA